MMVRNSGNRIMNTWLYPIENGWVMVDTGYENSYKQVLKKLRKLAIKPEDIRYIFLTHAHDDHAGFLKEWITKYPDTKVIAHEKAIDGLRKGQNSFDGGCSTMLAFLFCQLMALLGNSDHRYPGLSEEHLKKIITLNDDNIAQMESLLNGEILFTPGHTADSISLLVNGILFCGDAAMNGIPSWHKITIWVEDTRTFAASWEHILKSGVSMIYPAHGDPFEPKQLERNQKHLADIRLRPLKEQ